jgi:hypothetical protein
MKLALTFASAMVAVCSQALVLDDFTTGPYSVSIQSGFDQALQNGAMIGGQRSTYVEVQSNPLNQYLDFMITNGFQLTSSGTLVDAYTKIGYGATADLNANLAGYNAFKVRVISNDLPMNMAVTLSSSTGNQSETVAVVVPNGTFFDVLVPFSLFTSFNQFQDVDKISFGLDSVTNGDFALAGFEAVPEPATLLALGTGAAILFARRRK